MKWFRATKTLSLPVSPIGYLIWLVAVIFLVTVFIAVDRNAGSVSDLFYGVFPFVVPTFLLVEWVAGKTGAGR